MPEPLPSEETVSPSAGDHPGQGGLRRGTPRVALLAVLGLTLVGAIFGAYQFLQHSLVQHAPDHHTDHLLHVIGGITASLVLSAIAAFYMARYDAGGYLYDGEGDDLEMLQYAERQRLHVQWFIRMRWIAVVFTIALIAIAIPVTGLLGEASLPLLLGWWGVLVLANVAFSMWERRSGALERQMVVQILTDLLILTGMLNASGGIENPLHIAYVFHVIIAGILLAPATVMGITVAASVLVSGLAFGEYAHILPHYTNLLFPHAHILAPGIHPPIHAAHDLLFVVGRTGPTIAVLFLTAYFTTMVTERLRRTELQLQGTAHRAVLERRRLETVIDATGLGMLVVGSNGIVQWSNQRSGGWLGGSAQFRVGEEAPHQHGETPECLACIARETIEGGIECERECSVTADGRGTRFFRLAASPVRATGPGIVQAVLLIEDITQRKALESEALHSGKLSVLGQMAAGIAHEIGNPLASLDARLQIMKIRSEERSFMSESLEILKEQIDRIRRIVRGVSHFSANRKEGWSSWDLNGVADEALKLIVLDSRSASIEFVRNFDPRLPRVGGVRDQILQVAINLLLNAVEALPEGGRVEIATSTDGASVRLEVRDSGPGFDESVRTHLFEPFFTTKRDGTGLGLSICYTLVHAHGGTIAASNAEGGGARFLISIPAAATVVTGRRIQREVAS